MAARQTADAKVFQVTNDNSRSSLDDNTQKAPVKSLPNSLQEKEKELREFDEFGDGGDGWAGDTREVDYSEKLVFSDDEDSQLTKDTDKSCDGGDSRRREPSGSYDKDRSFDDHERRTSEGDKAYFDRQKSTEDQGPPMSREAWMANQAPPHYRGPPMDMPGPDPPVAPTSRNFVEMRDKLRLQLKRKKEIKSPASSTASDTISSAPMVSEVTESLRDEDPVWRMGVDELVRFINGEDEKKSAKTAKKARQKQKKALEKARKLEEEEEQQRRAEEAMKKRVEEEALRLQQMQLQQLQLQQQQQKQQESDSRNNKKRKGKQKESSSQSLDVRNGDSSTCAKGQQSTVNRSGTSSPVVHKKVSQPRQVSPRVSNQESSAQEQGRKKKTGSGKTPEDEVTSQNTKNTNLKNLCIAKSMAPENGRRIETLPPESGKKKKVNSQPLDKTKLDNTGSQIERVKNVNSTSGSQQNGKLRAEPRQDSPGSRQVQANNKGRVECDTSVQTPVKSTSAMVTMSENKENGVSPKSTDSSPQSGDGAGVPTPNKSRRKKRGKASEDIDEIFLPKQDLDLENGEMDAFEKELEEFKRFCFDSQSTQQRIKLPINLNVKDMRLKKKVPTSVGCG